MSLTFKKYPSAKDGLGSAIGACRLACRRLFKTTTPLALALATAGGASSALAQSVTFGGDTTPSNPGSVNSTVDVRVGTSVGGNGTLNIFGGGTLSGSFGYIGFGTGRHGTATVSGEGSSWTSANELYLGGQGGTGELIIQDGGKVSNNQAFLGRSGGSGTVMVSGRDSDGHASTWVVSSNLEVGIGGGGTLSITDGGVVNSQQGRLGYGQTNPSTSIGTVTVSGRDSLGNASLWTNSSIFLGQAGGSGTLTIENGGIVSSGGITTVATDSTSTGILHLNGDASARGVLETRFVTTGGGNNVVLDLNGGILRAIENQADFLNGFPTLALGAGGVWFDSNTHNIGVVTAFAGAGSVNKLGTGTLTLTGDSNYTGDATITGGTLQLGNGGLTGSITGNVANDGTLAFNHSNNITFDGAITGSGAVKQIGSGSVVLTGDSTYSGGTAIGVGTLQLGNSGTTGSVAGDVAVNGKLVVDRLNDLAFAGIVSGNGELVKNGAGTLVLGGDNSYLGATTVNAGTLRVNGDQHLATGTTTIAAGAALGGSGIIGGNVNIADGGILSPGNSPGTLTINGNLSLSNGSVLNYEFGQAGAVGGALNDLVNVGGNLTLDGTINVSVPAGGTFGPGIYRLFNYVGSLFDQGLDIGVMPGSGNVTVQTSIANQVNLVNTPLAGLSFWDGPLGPKPNGTIEGGSGSWHLGGGDYSWADQNGANNAYYLNGSFAVFAGAAGTVTIDNGAGVVTASGMQFASDGYVIDGQPLTLIGPQTTVQVGDSSAAGAGFTATIAADITGATQLVKTDFGTLVLAGNNTYTGGTAINGGTIRIASDANLGDAAGGLSFNGGALNTTADITSGRGVTLVGAGTILTDAATTAVLNGSIAGGGSLTKGGAGTLVLNGTNTYAGGTAINGGTLRIASDTNLGAGAGGLSFNGGTLNTTADVTSGRNINLVGPGTFLTDAGTTMMLTGNIAGSGTLVKDGTGILVLAGDAAQAGGSTIRVGTLQVGTGGQSGSLRGDVANDGLLAFDRSDNIRFDGQITGGGRLAQLGTGATTLTATSSYGGATDVFAGALVVNGSIANSAVLVHDGARLAGSGTVGATTVATGGTVAPGGSLTTLSVNGTYLQQAGAVYQVDVDPNSAASGRIAVTGAATLADGAVIQVTKTAASPYRLGTRYTVLSTTGGLSGSFNLTGQTDLTAFIYLVDAYDGNNAYLVTRQSRQISGVGGGAPNQIAVGAGIDQLLSTNPVRTAVLNLPSVSAARGALDQLSGEVHALFRTATIETSHFVRDAATDRLRTAFCGVAANTSLEGEYARDRQRSPADCSGSDRLTAWGQTFGSWGSTGSTGNAAKTDRSTSGFFVGADAPVFDTSWRLGVLAGYSHSNIDVDTLASSATTDDYHVGVYGGTQWGRLGFRTGATYTWQDISTNRTVRFEGFGDDLAADYRGSVAQAFGDLGYRIDAGRFALEPFVNLAYVHLDSEGFRERGTAAALSSAMSTSDTLLTTVGLRASSDFTVGGVDILARGSLGWRHASGDTTPVTTLAFDGSPYFGIAGSPIAVNAAVVNTGFDFALSKNATLSVLYEGQFSGDAVDQSVRGTFIVRF